MTEAMSQDERGELARLVVALLMSWGVAPGDQVRLLGLPAGTRSRAMRRHLEGMPFPDEPQVNERVEHLVGIADALRTSYPHNQSMAAMWMNRANRHFQDRRPLDVMLEDGLEGVVGVRVHLDCAYGWIRDDSAASRGT